MIKFDKILGEIRESDEGGVSWGNVIGSLSAQTDLQTALDLKVDENTAITGATKTKITYDAKGLVTSGADATTADIADSLNKRYVTDANLTVIGNTSGTNTGDQINITGNAATVTTNANLTGVITSVGNTTSIASQTGTGTKFVVDTSPTLVTPTLGVATATSITATGLGSFTGGLKVDASTDTAFDALYFRNSSAGASALTRASFRSDAGEQLIIDVFGSGYTGSLSGVNYANLVRITARTATSGLMIGTESTDSLYFITNNTVRASFNSSGTMLVSNDSQAALQFLTANATATTASQVQLIRARGTTASPTIISDGDLLGTILFRGYNTDYATGATIRAEADGEWGTAGDASDQPTRIIFATVPNGASGLTDKMIIDNAGLVGIGTSTPLTKLHLATAGASVLTLERVDGSVSANDSIGKIQFYAADTSTTTNFIVADIEAQATNNVGTDINPGRLIFRTTSTTVAATPTERMRIDEAGNVGIGTTAPLEELQVGSNGLLFSDNGVNNAFIGNNIYYDAGAGQFKYVETGLGTVAYFDSGHFTVRTAPSGTAGNAATVSEVFRITNTGNVGIGTTAPSVRLDVVDVSGNDRQTFRVERDVTYSNDLLYGVSKFIIKKSTNAGDGFGAGITFALQDDTQTTDSTLGLIGATRDGADNSGALRFDTYNAGVAGTSMYIKANGNVGIGTTAPSSVLHIHNSVPTITFTNTAGSEQTNTGQLFFSEDANTGMKQVYDGSANKMYFIGRDGGAETTAVTFTRGGLVGIGTTAPTGKLHIDQASTTGAIPSLILDQADVSEEFIEFVATSAADNVNPISTTAVGTYAGKLRINVNGTYYWLAYYNS